jgi:hypothetical protein
MMKFYLCLCSMLLMLSVVRGQEEDTSGAICPEGDFTTVGGKLNLVYDGVRLQMCLQIRTPDTSRFAKRVTAPAAKGQWYCSSIGVVRYRGKDEKIGFSARDQSIEKNNHELLYTARFTDIPMVINGEEALQVKLWYCRPDTTVFTCSGIEGVREAGPDPSSLSTKQVIWTKTGEAAQYPGEYAIQLLGSAKGAFGFSKLSLIEENKILDFFWDVVLQHLLLSFPCWLLLYLLIACRSYFEKIDPKMYGAVLKWLPWLVAFYVVLVLDRFFCTLFARAFINSINGRTVRDDETAVIGRIIGVTIAVALLVFQYLWKKSCQIPVVVFIKMASKTLAYSMLVYALMGILNLAALHVTEGGSWTQDLTMSLQFHVGVKYAFWVLLLVNAYFVFVFYQLFSFNKWFQWVSILLITWFALTENYRIMGNMKRAAGGKGSISFQSDISKLSEAKDGFLSLGISLLDETYRYALIPLLLATLFIIKQARRNRWDNTGIVMPAFFTLFFCCYIVSYNETFLLVPVTLIVALWLSRKILIHDNKTRLVLVRTSQQIYTLERSGFSHFQNMPELRQSERTKGIYKSRLLKGDLLPADYEKAVNDLDEMVGGPQAEVIRRRMEFGPYQEPWKNGLLGLKYGLIVSALIWIVYYKTYLLYEQFTWKGLPDVLEGPAASLLLGHIGPVLLNGLTGFCLGYFFPFLKGDTGWKKGAWLGVAIGAAHLPLYYLASESPGWTPLLGVFLKHVSILTIIGFLAFDLSTIRKIYGKRYTWRQMVEVTGWLDMLALGGLLLGAVGAGVSAWISGDVEELLRSFFK